MPLTPEQRSEWRLENGRRREWPGNGPVLAHCQELARQLVAALRDLETLQPADMQGLLEVVAREPPGGTGSTPQREAPGERALAPRDESHPSGPRPAGPRDWRLDPSWLETDRSLARSSNDGRARLTQCSNSSSKPAMSSLAIVGIGGEALAGELGAALPPQHLLEPVHERQQHA